MRLILLVFSLGFALYQNAFAEAEFPLSLSEAIRRSLMNDPDIQVERENIRIREAAELLERSQFDAVFHLNGGVKQFERRTTSLLETRFTEQIERSDLEWGLGWKKPFPWGGTYDLTVNAVSTESTLQTQNPTYTGDLSLVVTQPLLKGRGIKIKQAPLAWAKTEVALSRQTFLARATQRVEKIIALYWDLVFQRENLNVQQSSLALAQKLLELNKTKVALGVLAPIEILVAEVSVASREEGVIVAKKGVDDVEEQLRHLLRRDRSAGPLLPVDRPVEEEVRVDPKNLIQRALNERPDIKAAEIQIQNNALSVMIAQDQLRPSLDFVGGVGPSGIGTRFADPFDQFSSGDFYRWEASLVVTYPYGNRAARAALEKARAEQKKAELTKAKQVDQMILAIHEGQRRIQTDFQRIVAAQRAMELARKQLAAGEERFRLGLLSSHDLILFQNEAAVQAGNALRAVIDYNKSLANLHAVAGTLLAQYQIEIAP